MKRERANQREFREGVLKLLREKSGGFVFCQACPVNACGFDSNGREIPLDAHHTAEPYGLRHNQDPEIGTMICAPVHRGIIHRQDGSISYTGRELTEQFLEDPKKTRYDLDIICPHKNERETGELQPTQTLQVRF